MSLYFKGLDLFLLLICFFLNHADIINVVLSTPTIVVGFSPDNGMHCVLFHSNLFISGL